MTPSPDPAPRPPIDGWRWRIVWLLFLATLINYMDRLALNTTQRYLLPEFVPARVWTSSARLFISGGYHL